MTTNLRPSTAVRSAVTLFTSALLLRLVWNLWIHPPWHFIASDMAGYEQRASSVLDAPLQRDAVMAFFPYGTHFLVVGVKLLFGRDNHAAAAVFLAILGSFVPVFTFLIARRVSRDRIVPLVCGWAVVFFYPLISLGGYLLSEVPFCVALLACDFLSDCCV